MTKRSVLSTMLLAMTVARALAAAPGGTEVTCDVDRTQFRTISRGATQVVVRLWDAAVGGSQCGEHIVPVQQVEGVRTRKESIDGTPARTFIRLRTVIGNDGTPAALCPSARTWIDLTVGTTTIACDLAGRRRLVSVAYARESEPTSLPSTPTGTIVAFAGSVAPAGWLLCDGAAVSRTTYSALLAVLGLTYGAGDGLATFNIPDLRGRVVAGLGTHPDVNVLGDSDGLAVASRTPIPQVSVAPHDHAMDHFHGVNIFTGPEAAIGFDPSRRYPKNDFDNFSHGHGVVGNTGSSSSPRTGLSSPGTTVRAPGYLTAAYVIKF